MNEQDLGSPTQEVPEAAQSTQGSQGMLIHMSDPGLQQDLQVPSQEFPGAAQSAQGQGGMQAHTTSDLSCQMDKHHLHNKSQEQPRGHRR